MATYLDRILDHHRARAASDTRSAGDLLARCAELPPPRGFRRALVAGDRLAVIAEVKRRSPSRGALAPDLDPAGLARRYVEGGAACLSVLTDQPHFGGSAADLEAARAAVEVPVLRKDFTVDVRDVYDARLMGADCVLLIVAALSDGELADFAGAARQVGLDVLVEAHDEAEVGRGLRHAQADLVGVNQRDLVTFDVDRARALRVGATIPSTAVKVAESGIRGPDDAVDLAAAGFHAVLVGEHLVTSGDVVMSTAALAVPR